MPLLPLRRALALLAAGTALTLATAQAAPPADRAGAEAALARALPQLSYPVEGREVRLRDGTAAAAAAPGAATQDTVTLDDARAYGDLNGDGRLDAAAALWRDGGGSGRFLYLAAVLDSGGARSPLALPAVLLGDRVQLQRLSIEDGGILATWCERAPGEPMASGACSSVTHRYAVIDGRLQPADR